MVPSSRIRHINHRPLNSAGDYVLYWMVANRRASYNFSLERAVEVASELKKPIVVFEALRSDYRWASDRIHQFVIQGMHDNARAFAKKKAFYFPYIEPKPGDAKGLFRALAQKSCAVVTDDFPCFFIPRMIEVVGKRCKVAFEAIDSNGIYPMRSTDREFTMAHSFRRHLQKEILPHLAEPPKSDPLSRVRVPVIESLDKSITDRWPAASEDLLANPQSHLASIPIDHNVNAANFVGGSQAANKLLEAFMTNGLTCYAEQRNQPENDPSSGLSPYLHFGHISSHQVVEAVMEIESWTPDCVADKPNGSRNGWWGMTQNAEGYLDQIITWRELGYNMCALNPDYDQFDSLPDFALKTLAEHTKDKREYVYSLEQFENAKTHDEVWNAAQRELVTTGRMHNYLRMLWGKKILHWSAKPQDALEIMIELNNKYAVDGRNPNSYSGIFWTLGRYDRAWGPEREIFGKIRFMSSDSTRKKLKLQNYLKRFGKSVQQELF